MRSVLVGAVESTAVALRAILAMGQAPVAVVTLPPALRHRHSDFVDLGPLTQAAGVPLIEVANVNAKDSLAQLANLTPDVVWVIGWSQICGPEFLGIPRMGAIGYHPAKLPENRGRAVIPWTILQGASETGSTLFWLSEGMDDGDIISQEVFGVAEDETSSTLVTKHMRALESMITDLMRIELSEYPAVPQPHERATYCARRVAEDGVVDWALPARDVWRHIRAVGRPYPGAFAFLADRKVQIWSADYLGPRPIWAQAGQIVEKQEAGIVVQCGDREHVVLTDVDWSDGAPAHDLRIGQRLRSSVVGQV